MPVAHARRVSDRRHLRESASGVAVAVAGRRRRSVPGWRATLAARSLPELLAPPGPLSDRTWTTQDPPGHRSPRLSLTFTGVVFSITLVALQMASTQYSPRVLRTFVRKPVTKLALSTFIAHLRLFAHAAGLGSARRPPPTPSPKARSDWPICS